MKSRSLVILVLVALLISAMPSVMAQDGEQVLNAAFGVGPGGDEDGRPRTGSGRPVSAHRPAL